MAQPFKFRHQNEIVGAFVIFAVLTLLGAFFILVRGQAWLTETFEIVAVFDERGIGLLKAGTPVRVRNNTIGRVQEAHHSDDGRTEVTLDINVDNRNNVNPDSVGVLYVPMAGLPGEPFIEIKPGVSHEDVRPGHRIKARAAPDILQLAVDVLDDVHSELRPTFIEITALSRNLNRLIAIIEKSGEVPKQLAQVEKLEAHVDRVLTKVEGLLGTTGQTLGRVDKLVAKADHGDGLVSRALNDQRLYGQLVASLGRMHQSMLMVERLLARADKAGKALPQMTTLGVRALQDMVVVSTELRKLAPMMPQMVGQIDEVLFEGKAMMEAAERHWLLGGYLKPGDSGPMLMPGGLRDQEKAPSVSALREALGADATRPGGPAIRGNRPNPKRASKSAEKPK